jgi:hypothetical protein
VPLEEKIETREGERKREPHVRQLAYQGNFAVLQLTSLAVLQVQLLYLLEIAAAVVAL